MKPITVRFPDELIDRINQLSFQSKRSKSYLIVQAVNEHISELEDLHVAEMRLIEIRARKNSTRSLNDVERELGLAD